MVFSLIAVLSISFLTWMDGLFPRNIVSFRCFVRWSFFLSSLCLCRSCELWPEAFLGSLGLNSFEWGAQVLFCKNAFMKGPLLKFWNREECISEALKVTTKMIVWHYVLMFPLPFLRWAQLSARKKKNHFQTPGQQNQSRIRQPSLYVFSVDIYFVFVT